MPTLSLLSLVLFGAAGLGLLILAGILVCVVLHLRRPAPVPAALPGLSVLKPLCGVDDDLEKNLVSFAEQDYAGPWEVLLGVKDTQDPAYQVARRVVRKHPRRFRLLVQEGVPGLNPKVNQLVTLSRHARHEAYVVSDSNVRVHAEYLTEIAAGLTQPDVACVTHPVAGRGEEAFGSLMDNVHLATSVGPGQISAMMAAGKPLVVGKSMAMWKADLEQVGGFMGLKDFLAEDYVFGRWVGERLGKRVVVGHTPVHNYSRNKTVADFVARYRRWGVIHRTAVSLPTSLGQGLLQPGFFALLGFMAEPSRYTFAGLLAVLAGKVLVDVGYLEAIRPGPVTARLAVGILVKDFIVQCCWLNGFVERTVNWRGNRLRVGLNSQLLGAGPAEPSLSGEQADVPPSSAAA